MNAFIVLLASIDLSWPKPTQTMKPWAYNWWMGSAVDEAGFEYQCSEMAAKGFGGFHVIPIYGANGPDGRYRKLWKPLLSREWIGVWNLGVRVARKHGLGVDLTMGSGWCFGGPWIDKEHAASSGMKVKRAGIGGQGYMIDPFSADAMRLHVSQFEPMFGRNGKAERPRAFYHDSYEYYGARPKSGQDVNESQIACFRAWTDWCRENGYLTRNEAHGAPANWMDLYALADIPETEMFGRANGNRDILLSKTASSTAHVKGSALVAAETCTWVDNHFCERPEDIRIMVDQLFLSGVNHLFYHGLCYSPVDAVWPGWTFYAALEMNPRNPIWREIATLNAYITRCQSIFQTWAPDNDLAILFDPDHDAKEKSVHNGAEWFYSKPMGALGKQLLAEGYQFDWISPRLKEQYGVDKYKEFIDPAQGKRPVKAVRSPFGGMKGLYSTRWRKGEEVMHFVVNHTSSPLLICSESNLEYMDPMTGKIAADSSFCLNRNHSVFVKGNGLRVMPDVERMPKENLRIKEWTVEGVVGGPELPAKRTLSELVDWTTFDENFSGTMRYSTEFEGKEILTNLHSSPTNGTSGDRLVLCLGEVREIARVRLNGRDLGCCLVPPYEFEIPQGLLKPEINELEIEVTNLGANRLRWNDRTGVNWKYFTDINMVEIDYRPLDASKWTPMRSGLMGPIEIRLAR